MSLPLLSIHQDQGVHNNSLLLQTCAALGVEGLCVQWWLGLDTMEPHALNCPLAPNVQLQVCLAVRTMGTQADRFGLGKVVLTYSPTKVEPAFLPVIVQGITENKFLTNQIDMQISFSKAESSSSIELEDIKISSVGLSPHMPHVDGGLRNVCSGVTQVAKQARSQVHLFSKQACITCLCTECTVLQSQVCHNKCTLTRNCPYSFARHRPEA